VVFGDIPASLTVYGPEDDALFDGYIDLLNTVDKEMSMWNRPYVTDVMRMAAAAGKNPVEVSADTTTVLTRALQISALTEGALDVAIGPIVKLWGVATDHPEVPPEAQIKALLPLISPRDIVLKGTTAYLRKPGMIVDVGGIAKGFAADKARDYLIAEGVKSAIVDIGGNVYVIGGKPKAKGGFDPWRIGIQDPFQPRGNIIGTVSATSTSIVTSGVYERKFKDPKSGKTYTHILNPKTGWPIDNGVVSVTIVNTSSTDCDGFCKVIVLGLKEGLKVLQENHLEGIFVTADKKVYITPQLEKNFHLTASDYQLADLP